MTAPSRKCLRLSELPFSVRRTFSVFSHLNIRGTWLDSQFRHSLSPALRRCASSKGSRLLAITFLLALLCSCSRPASSDRQEGQSVDAIEQHIASDFPPQITGDEPTRRFSFSLTNTTGKSQHDLKAVATSCSCVHATVDRGDLEPGEETAVYLDAAIGGRVGPQRVTCRVASAGGALWTLEATTILYPRVAFVPDYLSLDDLTTTGENSAMISIESRSSPGQLLPQLLRFKAMPDCLIVENIHTLSDGRTEAGITKDRTTCTIRLRPGAIGDGRGTITLAYNYDGVVHDCTLPVAWKFRKYYELDPPRVFFGCVENQGTPQSCSVTLRHVANRPLSILHVKSSHPAVTCTFTEGSRPSHSLVLRLSSNAFSRFMHGLLSIETDLKDTPNVTIPFAAYNKDALTHHSTHGGKQLVP